jgi:hypothetical protein
VKNKNKRGNTVKKLIVLFVVIYFNSLFAQDTNTSSLFTHYSFGFYGGINSGISSETGTTFLIESKTKLIPNLYLNLSLGYSKRDINERGYDIIPLSLGCQYIFKNNTISPYLLFDLCYDVIITTRDYTTYGITYQYPSYEAIPDEYKTNQGIPSFTNYSYGIVLGVGGIYNLSAKLNLDIRYFYKYDSKIVNSNQVIIGIYF